MSTIKAHRKRTKALGCQCRWEAGTGKGLATAPAAPCAGAAHPQGGILWAGQSRSHCPSALCHRWREMGRCGYGFSDRLGWGRWSSSSAHCGRDGMGWMAQTWLQFLGHVAALGKLFLNLTAAVVRNGLISNVHFLLFLGIIFYDDNLKLVALQCGVVFGSFHLHMYLL